MAVSEIQDALLSVFEGTVDTMASRLALDKTVKATVVKCIDAISGEYMVSYNGGSMRAFSDNRKSYSQGTGVYVLVPEGDFSNKKTIVGTVDTQDENNYLFISSVMDDYNPIGSNTISTVGEKSEGRYYELSSYCKSQITNLYTYGGNSNVLDVDQDSLRSYIKHADGLRVGAKFRTNLPYEHQIVDGGDYGIVIRLAFVNQSAQGTYKNNNEVVTNFIYKDYILNTSSSGFIGNPRKLPTFIEEYEFFEIDNEAYDHMERIDIYCQNFGTIDCSSLESKLDSTVYVKDIEIFPLQKITDVAEGYRLKLSYPRGSVFKAEGSSTEIMARLINNGSLDLSEKSTWYWFKKDLSVGQTSENYHTAGGIGWRYLGSTAASNHFLTSERENRAYENEYKVVVDYQNQVRLKANFILYNELYKYSLRLESSLGTEFNFDQGATIISAALLKPDGTVATLGTAPGQEDIYYYWEITDRGGNTYSLEDTNSESDNTNANEQTLRQLEAKIEDYEEELLALSKNNVYTKEKIALERKRLSDLKANTLVEMAKRQSEQGRKSSTNQAKQVTYFFTDTTPNSRHINFKYMPSSFDQFVTIKAMAIDKSKNETRAYGELVLNNKGVVDASLFHIVLENANQVFKYNEAGVSPINERYGPQRQEILPIKATLYAPTGTKVENVQVEFLMTSSSSMIVKPDNSRKSTDDRYIIIDSGSADERKCTFSIQDSFSADTEDDQITVVMKVDGKEFRQRTNFYFLKVGDNGNNGTDLVCRITPGNYTSGIPYIFHRPDNNNTSWYWYYNDIAKTKDISNITTLTGDPDNQLTVSLYKTTGKITNPPAAHWSIAGVDTTSNTKITSYLFSISNNGVLDIAKSNNVRRSEGDRTTNPDKNGSVSHSIRIVRAYVDYQDGSNAPEKRCYAFFAIPTVDYTAAADSNPLNKYTVKFDSSRCFQYVTYNSNGKDPAYKANAGLCLERPDFDWTCVWTVYGGRRQTGTDADIRLMKSDGTLVTSVTTSGKGQTDATVGDWPFIKIVPNDTYSGLYTNNYVKCVVNKKKINSDGTTTTTTMATIRYPICMTLNRYELESLNVWDGNTITVNKDDGYILAPQIGAGKKANDNSFTGIVMGERVRYSGSNPVSDTGLFGYADGKQSIFLNSEDGSAHFGLPEVNESSMDNGTINLVPGGTSNIGNWNIGKYSLYSGFTSSEKEDPIVQIINLNTDAPRGYVATTNTSLLGRYSPGMGTGVTRDKYGLKVLDNDGLDTTHTTLPMAFTRSGYGTIISSNPPFLSIKGKPITAQDGFNFSDPATDVKEGDSFEVEIDPSKYSLFTIYLHTQEDRGNGRFPKVGIDAKGRFYTNALRSGSSDMSIGPVGAFGYKTSDPSPNKFQGADFRYRTSASDNEGTSVLKFFMKEGKLGRVYISASSTPINNSTEYEKEISLHGSSLSGYIADRRNRRDRKDIDGIPIGDLKNGGGPVTDAASDPIDTDPISEETQNYYKLDMNGFHTQWMNHFGSQTNMDFGSNIIGIAKNGAVTMNGSGNVTFRGGYSNVNNTETSTSSLILNSNGKGQLNLDSTMDIVAGNNITTTASGNITLTSDGNDKNIVFERKKTNITLSKITLDNNITLDTGGIYSLTSTGTGDNTVTLNGGMSISAYNSSTKGSASFKIQKNSGDGVDILFAESETGTNKKDNGGIFAFTSMYNGGDTTRKCQSYLRLNPSSTHTDGTDSGMATYGNLNLLSYESKITIGSRGDLRIKAGPSDAACGTIGNENDSRGVSGITFSSATVSNGGSTFNIRSDRGSIRSTHGEIDGEHDEDYIDLGTTIHSHYAFFDGEDTDPSHPYALYATQGAQITGGDFNVDVANHNITLKTSINNSNSVNVITNNVKIKNADNANTANTTTISGGDVSAGGNVSASSLTIGAKNGMDQSWFDEIQVLYNDYHGKYSDLVDAIDTAQTAADTAQTTADRAKTDASNAQTTADEAKTAIGGLSVIDNEGYIATTYWVGQNYATRTRMDTAEGEIDQLWAAVRALQNKS